MHMICSYEKINRLDRFNSLLLKNFMHNCIKLHRYAEIAYWLFIIDYFNKKK